MDETLKKGGSGLTDASSPSAATGTPETASSYKSPLDLVSAPSSGKVSIAGRRLATGEIVPSEIIHLQDFPAAKPSTAADTPAVASPPSPMTPAHPGAATSSSSGIPDSSIQETTKTAEHVCIAHASVAAAAAAAGGLVGGVHLDVRTAANVAEATVDPGAVVDFDCSRPAAASSAAAAAAGGGLSTASSFEPDTPSAAAAPVSSSSPLLTQQETQQGGNLSSTPTGFSAAARSTCRGNAALQSVSGGVAGHAVAPEDREEVASTLQRLRSAGLLQGPAAPHILLARSAAAEAASTEDSFIGGSGSASKGSAATAAGASRAAGPSMQGVSAGTAAPALAGYPDAAVGTAAEVSRAAAAAEAPASTAHADAATMSSSSSSNLLIMHDVAACAAAVAGALHHVGQPVPTAAVLAETATQPAQAIEAAAAAAASVAASSDDGSTGRPMAGRASSLHQQHTLADFLQDVPAAAAAASAASPAEHSTSVDDAAHMPGTAAPVEQVDLAAGTTADSHDDLQVQLDVGRSTRLLSPDGRVAAAAATVPHEAVAAIKGDTAEASAAPKSPRHPSLRQLSMFADQGSSSSQADKPAPEGLPYGLTVADIVAATIASEERRFRVMSPRSSQGNNLSPRSPADTFFTASSSGSTGSVPVLPDSASGAAVERSSSPLSSAATRAIFDSVQLAMQQQQDQEQLAESVARSVSLSLKQAGSMAADSAGASTTCQMQFTGSSGSTATGSGPSGCPSSSMPAGADTAKGGAAGPAPAAADVTEQNARVMQDMLQQEVAGAVREAGAAAARAGPAASGTESSSSIASQYGDSVEQQLSSEDKAGALSSSRGTTEAGSGPVSSSSKVAAAVAAEKAGSVNIAVSGADVASTAAPAFPSAVFGLGPLPVDVPASSSPASTGSHASSAEQGRTGGGAGAAAVLASSGMAALTDAAVHGGGGSAGDSSLVQRVADAAASAAIHTADEGVPAAMAAAAAAATAEQHGDAADPAIAAADAAQLVVDAASALPGLLEPSEVASAAASAGAAAAAAATPGMDAAAAAIACAAAAAAPMSDPAGVGAAAAKAVADLQDMGPDAASAGAGSSTGLGTVPAGGEMGVTSAGMSGAVGGAQQHSPAAGVVEPICAADLGGVLPILAPAGHIGDTLPVSSGVAVSTAGAGTAFQRAAGQLDTVPESPGATSSSSSNAADSSAGMEAAGAQGAQGEVAGTAEVLNMAGRSRMYDPLIVQLAMASSAPLEHLGLDASALVLGGGGARAVLERAGVGTSSGSDGGGKSRSGVLMMQPHPLAASGSFSASTAPPGDRVAEGSSMYQHLAAAEEALAKLELQRQRTDSISLGAGLSSAPGELDDAAAAALAASGAQAPAGPDEAVA